MYNVILCLVDFIPIEKSFVCKRLYNSFAELYVYLQ